MVKFYGIDGEERTPPNLPVASVIEAARAVLAKAESGDLRQIAACCISRSGGLITVVKGEGSWLKLLGSIYLMARDVTEAINAVEPGDRP